MPPEESEGEGRAEAEESRDHVLIAHEDVTVARLMREALESFTEAEVVTTPDAEYAFELALQRPYKLFIFQITMPVLKGELLYSLISKAYSHRQGEVRRPPAVIYVADGQDPAQFELMQQDARVKGVLMKPLNIERLLEKACTVLARRG